MINPPSWVRLTFLVGAALALSACTASKDIRTAQKKLRSVPDYRGVNMTAVTKPLNEYRKTEEDEVLYHLEHGMLAHFREQWNQSSQHFERAQRAIDRHFTKSINRNVQSMLVNDLQLAYHGEAYEDIYLNAVKSLNYLHQDDLEGAMVEARKVTHELEQLSDRYKGLAESVSRDTAQTAVKKVDSRLEGVNLIDQDEETGPVEVEQNSAFGRFLTTVLYAKRGSPDDARIERRKLHTALQDQGNTDFLATLFEDRERTSPGLEDTERSTASLAVRLTPNRSSRPPSLTIRVNGVGAYTLPGDSLQPRENAYAARIEGISASNGDSISIQPDGSPQTGTWLEVWSDSLQYRAPLGDGREPAAFVLGTPDVQSPPRTRSMPRRSDTDTEKGETSLTSASLSYAVTRRTTSTRRQRTLVRTIERVRNPDGVAWRVAERSEPALGTMGGLETRADTMHLSQSTLTLERYTQTVSDGHRLTVRREGRALIETANDWHIIPAEVPIEQSPYGEGVGLEMALADRSLSTGEAFSLPVYVSSRRQVESIDVQVLGTDSVSTPAGHFAAYEIRLIPPAAHQGTGRLYLRKSPPHHVVQATLKMPIWASGRRDTLRVQRTLTKIEDLDRAPPRNHPVAIADGPPSNLPTIAVEAANPGSDVPSMNGRSAGESATGPQLTRASTYNTMLVSFSGQAPVKRERKFSFNFRIQGEEFQLDFAIPVLELQGTSVDRVRAIAAGDTVQVPLLENMESVAETMFDEKKSIIYTRAVIRSFLKAAATKGAQKLAKEEGNKGMAVLAKHVGQMASKYVAQADTRGWQTMPGFAYATVARFPQGTHEVTFEFLSSGGRVLKRRTRQIEVQGTDDLALAESIYLE